MTAGKGCDRIPDIFGTIQGIKMSEMKKKAGYQAAEMVQNGQSLGLGTGSTVFYFLERLGERIRNEGLSVRGIPTSIQTEEQAREVGIPLTTFDEIQELDFCVDGADEIDYELNMIKGGGGALLREKMVASASGYKLIIVDESKLVERLGSGFALPVEVVPFGWKLCEKRLEELGCTPYLRMDGENAFKTNNGNYILDCRFEGGIKEPDLLESELNQMAGLLCNGLFINLADEALVGRENGVESIRKKRP